MLLDDEANWDQPLFPIGVIARGGRFSANTARSWKQRGHVTLEAKRAAANGLADLLTFRSGLTLGVTAELVELGETPKAAFYAATMWANFSDEGQTSAYVEAPRRGPGGLYPPEWHTLMVSSSAPDLYTVIPTPRVNQVDGIFLPMVELVQAGGSRVRIVVLNVVHARMRAACDEHLRKTTRRTFADMKAELQRGLRGS